jgi:hypothetical protein
MNIFDKIIHFLIALAVSCIIVFSVITTYWLYFPYNVIDIKEPITVLTKEVKQGEICEFEITYTKHLDILGQRQVQLVNGMIVTLEKEPEYVHLKVGKDIKYRVGFLIPAWYPEGYCHVELTTIHHVNPLRTVVEKFSTEEFRVTKHGKSK